MTKLAGICHGCRAELRIPSEWLSRPIRCPKCGAQYSVKSNSPVAIPEWLVAGLMGIVAIIGAGTAFSQRLQKEQTVVSPTAGSPATLPIAGEESTLHEPEQLTKTVGAFPRRMLLISVNNYLYLSPTSFGPPRRNLAVLTSRLAAKLRIPNEQVFMLSDSAVQRESLPPTKAMIESAMERFMATSREQDRIVVMYVGHSAVVDGKAYLIPLDGEPEQIESLVSLDWLFEKLKNCKARQKVLVWDTNRLEIGTLTDRPGPLPMNAELEKALKNPPEGVQVWSACSASQFSYEFKSKLIEGFDVQGGLFMSFVGHALPRMPAGIPKPDDSIPIAALSSKVNDLLQQVKDSLRKTPQTPFFAGKEPQNGVAYDSSAKAPSIEVLPKTGEKAGSGFADPKFVMAILDEVRLPPIKQTTKKDGGNDAGEPTTSFLEKSLAEYGPDYESLDDVYANGDKYAMRITVLKAIEMMRRQGRGEVRLGNSTKRIGMFRMELNSPVPESLKTTIALEQRDGPAILLVELEDALAALEKLRPERMKETSKRWQANYDYVLAKVLARYAYMNEYNLMLGKVRKDELPPVEPKIHRGWKLIAQEKMASPREVKDKAEDAQKLFDSLIKSNPGTPWEVLAKRERRVHLGLSWQTAEKN